MHAQSNLKRKKKHFQVIGIMKLLASSVTCSSPGELLWQCYLVMNRRDQCLKMLEYESSSNHCHPIEKEHQRHKHGGPMPQKNQV